MFYIWGVGEFSSKQRGVDSADNSNSSAERNGVRLYSCLFITLDKTSRKLEEILSSYKSSLPVLALPLSFEWKEESREFLEWIFRTCENFLLIQIERFISVHSAEEIPSYWMIY